MLKLINLIAEAECPLNFDREGDFCFLTPAGLIGFEFEESTAFCEANGGSVIQVETFPEGIALGRWLLKNGKLNFLNCIMFNDNFIIRIVG